MSDGDTTPVVNHHHTVHQYRTKTSNNFRCPTPRGVSQTGGWDTRIGVAALKPLKTRRSFSVPPVPPLTSLSRVRTHTHTRMCNRSRLGVGHMGQNLNCPISCVRNLLSPSECPTPPTTQGGTRWDGFGGT